MSNIESISKLPLWKSAVETASDLGMLSYGGFIPYEWLEDQLHERRDGPKFNFEKIQFCAALKKLGYIASERGTRGKGLRILEKDQMADHVRKAELAKIKQTFNNANCLGAVDTSDMKPIERDKVEFWERKANLIGMAALSMMRRKKLPEPNMVVQSLKQLQGRA